MPQKRIVFLVSVEGSKKKYVSPLNIEACLLGNFEF